MTGEEMKALRMRAGLSQAELASAIGMSRESIGRMERSADTVEKRTELALRYIAQQGAPVASSFEQVINEANNVLDDASIHANPSMQRTEKLKHALEKWTAAGGSETGRKLIYRAQGVIGLINVTDSSNAAWHQIMSDLRAVKLEWQAVRG